MSAHAQRLCPLHNTRPIPICANSWHYTWWWTFSWIINFCGEKTKWLVLSWQIIHSTKSTNNTFFKGFHSSCHINILKNFYQYYIGAIKRYTFANILHYCYNRRFIENTAISVNSHFLGPGITPEYEIHEILIHNFPPNSL